MTGALIAIGTITVLVIFAVGLVALALSAAVRDAYRKGRDDEVHAAELRTTMARSRERQEAKTLGLPAEAASPRREPTVTVRDAP